MHCGNRVHTPVRALNVGFFWEISLDDVELIIRAKMLLQHWKKLKIPVIKFLFNYYYYIWRLKPGGNNPRTLAWAPLLTTITAQVEPSVPTMAGIVPGHLNLKPMNWQDTQDEAVGDANMSTFSTDPAAAALLAARLWIWMTVITCSVEVWKASLSRPGWNIHCHCAAALLRAALLTHTVVPLWR